MTNVKQSVWRGLAALLLAVAASACGSDGGSEGEGGAQGADGAGGGAPAAEAGDTPDRDAVRSCLEQGGFELSESTLTPELQGQLGIEEQISVAGSDELVGLGSVTWYVDADTAASAHEAGGAVRTDDVARGVRGSFDYHYAGSDAAVARLEGCL